MAKRPQRIVVRIEGAASDRGHVRFNEFIRQLDRVLAALRVTTRSDDGAPKTFWRVVDLQHNSPAMVALEEVEVADDIARAVPPKVGSALVTQVGRITKSPKAIRAEQRDLNVLEVLRTLGATDGHIERLQLTVGTKKVTISDRFRTNIEKIIGPDDRALGSVAGRVEVVNLHNVLKCNLYPIAGPKRVVCEFGPEHRASLVAAVDRFVTVRGVLKTKQWARFPHAVEVEAIDILPDDSELPTLDDLRGIAPRTAEDLTALDFVEAHRRDTW